MEDGLDALDQPACAWGTGYRNASSCPYAPNKTRSGMSIAERLRARNRCNHRDFMNYGVNGMRSTAVNSLVQTIARDPALDHPALVIFSLIGNDVCNGHPGTTHMTPPAVFKSKILEALGILDKKLPQGSYVLLVGLVDGRVLWDTMSERQHPLGTRYKDVYAFLNCNQVNPCHGWLNANASLRNETTRWARSLNEVYKQIVGNHSQKFSNFKMQFYDPDWEALIQKYVQAGGDAGDVIEPSDGFHPSQTGNELLSEALWNYLETNFSEAIGQPNENNDAIMKMFGDQGGF